MANRFIWKRSSKDTVEEDGQKIIHEVWRCMMVDTNVTAKLDKFEWVANDHIEYAGEIYDGGDRSNVVVYPSNIPMEDAKELTENIMKEIHRESNPDAYAGGTFVISEDE